MVAISGNDTGSYGDDKPSFFARWFYSTNHKDIGTLYLIFGIISGLIGGFLSFMMRMELGEPGIQFFTNEHQYLVFVSMHGLIMIFLHGHAGIDWRFRQLVRPDYDRGAGYGVPAYE